MRERRIVQTKVRSGTSSFCFWVACYNVVLFWNLVGTSATFADERRELVIIGEPPSAGSGLQSVANGAYQPQTRILDHQRIGYDQQEMAENLDNLDFEGAFNMYKNGGHASSVATITLGAPFPTAIQERTIVLGESETSQKIRGGVTTSFPPQTQIMNVAYPINEDGPHCFVGGKVNPVTDGCFSSSQNLIIAGQIVSEFAYIPSQDTKNIHTLQLLATDADGIFRECEFCPLETYLKYVSYYGDFAYTDVIIMAAFQQSATNLYGANVDFGSFSARGRAEVIERISLNLVLWMAVVGRLEYSLEICAKQDPSDYGINYWDSAVGYYIGVGTNSSSALLYGLADQLCPEFGTCDANGIAAVNREMLLHFQSGQSQLSRGLCEDAKNTKNRIVSLMTVPIIQGSLYYSLLLRGNEDDRILGAAYSFLAALLPLLNDCNSDGLGIVFSSVQIPQSDASKATDFFPLVKGFLEDQYECLGVSCQDVGTLFGADLCTGQEDDDEFLGGGDDVISSSLTRNLRLAWISGLAGQCLSALL